VANVVYLRPTTGQDIPVSRVLEAAQDCAVVLVLGWGDAGFYAASSTGDSAELLWLVERFKRDLLAGEYT
jgi:hypothetical protein